MEPKFLCINKVILLLEFAELLDNHPSLAKIIDNEGNIVIPTDRFEDFSYDFGIIFGRLVSGLVEPYEKK